MAGRGWQRGRVRAEVVALLRCTQLQSGWGGGRGWRGWAGAAVPLKAERLVAVVAGWW